MRAIPQSLDRQIVAEVDRRLLGIESDYGVRIPWAIESGSRAWGFPSPDSDYDCRFIFVRPGDEYLALWAERDVIEIPVDTTFDVNGWDLAKAIKLICKGNATAIEWLRSPIIYSGDRQFRDDLLEFATEVVDRSAIGRHYLHVAHRQRTGRPTLKRFFYVLRPTLALHWLRVHPGLTMPPMDLPTLVKECPLSDDVVAAVHELIVTKAATHELGNGTPPTALRQFVSDELDRATQFDGQHQAQDPQRVRAVANQFFSSQLR